MQRGVRIVTACARSRVPVDLGRGGCQRTTPYMNLASKVLLATSLLATWPLAGCDVNVSASSRNFSGTDADHYVEEPLSESSKEYAPALEFSNQLVDRLQRGEFREIHAEHCGRTITSTVTQEQFVAMLQRVQDKLGPITRYKPVQWDFMSRTDKNGRFVTSTQIVEHERGMMEYSFVFKQGGPYDKQVGIKFDQLVSSKAATETK